MRHVLSRSLVLSSAVLYLCHGPNAWAEKSAPEKVKLQIAAAADLQSAMPEVIRAYQALRPGQEISSAFGASGKFTTQIQQGAPFDLFFSADSDFPKKLSHVGLVEGEAFPYATGHLALWVLNESKLDLQQGLNVLLSDTVKRIAIANPATAPYGRAAEEALKKQTFYNRIESKIVKGENIAQAAQFAESGAAEIGIIAVSLAHSPTLAKEGRYREVDPSLYTVLVQSGVVLKSGTHKIEAKEFRDFILSADGQKILASFGLGSLH